VLDDALDDPADTGVISAQAKVGQEGEPVDRVPGRLVAGEDLAGPALKPGDELDDPRMGQHLAAGQADLGVRLVFPEKVKAGSISRPRFRGDQPSCEIRHSAAPFSSLPSLFRASPFRGRTHHASNKMISSQ